MAKQEQQVSRHKVRTAYNYIPSKGKKFTMLSLTQPDQAIPLQVLLERHTKGMPLGTAMRTPLYEDENDRPEFGGINIATLDLVELQDLKNMAQQRIEQYTKDVKQQKKLKDEEDLKKWQDEQRQLIKDQLVNGSNSGTSNSSTELKK